MDDSTNQKRPSKITAKQYIILTCNTCKDTWVQRRAKPPKRCPHCQSRKWNLDNQPQATHAVPWPQGMREFIQGGAILVDKRPSQIKQFLANATKCVNAATAFTELLITKTRYTAGLVRGAHQAIASPRYELRSSDPELLEKTNWQILIEPAEHNLKEASFNLEEGLRALIEIRRQLQEAGGAGEDAVETLESWAGLLFGPIPQLPAERLERVGEAPATEIDSEPPEGNHTPATPAQGSPPLAQDETPDTPAPPNPAQAK
jgi:ribosomal protein L37AE/L43A